MPQPRWQNIQAPTFAGTSQILKNANTALSQGLSSASSLLEKYQAGKRQKNDNEISAALAGIQDEQSLDKYLQSGALDGKDISDELRADILNFRGSLIEQQGQRNTNELRTAQTAGVKQNTAYNSVLTDNAVSAEARRAVQDQRNTVAYDRKEQRRLSDLELADEIVNSTGAARNVRTNIDNPAELVTNVPYGTKYTGARLENGIYDGLRDRGINDIVARGFMTNFKDESNFDAGVNEKNPTVPGSRGGFGLYQLTGPRRVAFEQYAAANNTDVSNIDAQLDFMVQELGGPESAAYQKIQQARTPEEAASLIASEFLRPSEGALKARQAKYSKGQIWSPRTTENPREGTQTTKDADAAYQAQVTDLTQKMLAAGYTGDEINARIANLEKTRNASVSRFEAEQKAARNEELRGTYLDAIANPENTSTSDLIQGVLDDPRYETNAEKIQAAERLINLGGGVFRDVLAPPIGDTGFDVQTEILAAEERNRRQNNPQKALFDTVRDYSDDPVGSLMSELNIGQDGQNDDKIKQRDSLRRKVNELSVEKGVSPAVAAVALREVFNRDPFGPNDGSTVLGFVSGFDATGRRFNQKKAGEFIDAMLDQDEQFTFDAENIISKSNEGDIRKLNEELRALMSQAAKYKGDIPADLVIKITQKQNQIANF